MKKIIIGAIAFILVLVGIVVINNPAKVYQKVENVANSDVLKQVDNKEVFYYYNVECAHCHEFIPTLSNYSRKFDKKDGVDLKLVNVESPENKGKVFTSEDDPEFQKGQKDLSSIKEVKIIGTPTAITVENGIVTNYAIGADQITQLFDDELK